MMNRTDDQLDRYCKAQTKVDNKKRYLTRVEEIKTFKKFISSRKGYTPPLFIIKALEKAEKKLKTLKGYKNERAS